MRWKSKTDFNKLVVVKKVNLLKKPKQRLSGWDFFRLIPKDENPSSEPPIIIPFNKEKK